MSLESIALSQTGQHHDGRPASEPAEYRHTPIRGILFGLMFSVPLWALAFFLFR
ncbi:hypothetical protein [Komagataeibacter diospyri]|uniref:Uncharacterized protein n=1 Tax=Komagataeibacter diospyri TaxID=1932662 RepID=A0A4P5NL27_9PROT|nr:hypothetical protein [Komagataeibacter diospyri]GCE82063.1 hypothetical protein MSKU9_0204 [Komagataeibacter diospyri]GCE90828.1 hypothetical protein MSKU15_2429 [Komagataeibacter diospyri]